ncbi:rhodanese-like domain-containing protein [Sulfuriferula thiophila]|uniref:rhodanese-like domain-containing protein n=1 Tax=Sulfuriferula thiophila TaxID=1781211 RepID=UPI000F60A932|nr:rhodanese-like domain-containing protein [Sulfuriferula thiophila]
MQQISAQQLHLWLTDDARPAPVLLDVREPWEYQIAHISGAQLIPMHTVPAQLDKLDAHANIVVICHHGMRSMQIAHFLERAGFGHIYNLQGGVDAWAQSVDLNMPTY